MQVGCGRVTGHTTAERSGSPPRTVTSSVVVVARDWRCENGDLIVAPRAAFVYGDRDQPRTTVQMTLPRPMHDSDSSDDSSTGDDDDENDAQNNNNKDWSYGLDTLNDLLCHRHHHHDGSSASNSGVSSGGGGGGRQSTRTEQFRQVIAKTDAIYFLTESGRVFIWCANWNREDMHHTVLIPGGIIADRCLTELTPLFDRYCSDSTCSSWRKQRPDPICQMEIGDTASFFVSESGDVYVMGTNNARCMGLRYLSPNDRIKQPRKLDSRLLRHERCVRVACAGLSTRFVTLSNNDSQEHHIFSCGTSM